MALNDLQHIVEKGFLNLNIYQIIDTNVESIMVLKAVFRLISAAEQTIIWQVISAYNNKF